MDFFSNFKSWLTHSAWPTIETFLGGVVHDEVAAVAPIAQSAVNELAAEEATALATGDAKNTGHILAVVVRNTTQKMQIAGISAAAPSVLAAIGGSLPKPAAGS